MIYMTLRKCFCKTTSIGDFFFKNRFSMKANVKTIDRLYLSPANKNVFSNFHNTSYKSSSLVKEPSNLSKKRFTKKKKSFDAEEGNRIIAFSTAEEYDLENLTPAIAKFTKFKPSTFGTDYANSIDVIHARENSEPESLSKDLFFFRNGSVVMWNLLEFEINEILNFLKIHEENGFVDDLIRDESEVLYYSVSNNVGKTRILNDSLILSAGNNIFLEKYAISNAMALSVHLGAYEANLEQYIDTMEPVTEDLKAGNKIKMSRSEVLQKTGQLFALRHKINLSSDLLDTPDFYWDREELETLYLSIFNYYCINKRTKVMNEKINHCIELVDLLSSHLNDKHHVRLEWMIIILIMVEVAFEFSHYMEKYLESEKSISS